MRCQHLPHERDALTGRQIGEADKSAVPGLAQEDVLAEVLVQGYEDSLTPGCLGEEGPIARVRAEFASLHNIVTFSSQPLGEAPARAAVDEEPHAPYAWTASMESLAMTACA